MRTMCAPDPGDPYLDRAAKHAAAMLAELGIAGVDEQTAMRMVRALDELAAGRWVDPLRHLAVNFPPVARQPGLVVVTDIPFTSLCEHHILPFTGVATVAYLPAPGAPIIGLSKLARMVVDYAARPQVQERLTDQVATALAERRGSWGAACAIRAVHACMALRGARTGARVGMVTTTYLGELDTAPWRGDFTARLTGPAWS